MDRRAFLHFAGLGTLGFLLQNGSTVLASDRLAPAGPFSWETLQADAQALSAQPFKRNTETLPAALAEMDYDEYRAIAYRRDRAIWRDEGLPYQLQLFHTGYIYRDRVAIHVVENGQASEIEYDPSLFQFSPTVEQDIIHQDSGFSGFRLHAPIKRPDYFEEFLVFQGGSYFRGRAKGQTYGLSARGLSINTAQPGGEEFPLFRSFWIERPKKEDSDAIIYALLDSESTTAAYRFRTNIKNDTVMDIECRIYPRRTMSHTGIAPFSSMYFFGPADHTKRDDFRPRVHDSDGLLIQTSEGNWIWRPLVTADHILYSVFNGGAPRGFGLMQRERKQDSYQDFQAHYDIRPSTWVEPLSDWGEGTVDLIELPTNNEYTDNVVAFWRPKHPLKPGQEHVFRYRLTWCWHVPVKREIAKVVRTANGKGPSENSRYIIIDFAGGQLNPEADHEHWDFDVSASAGHIRTFTVGPNRYDKGKRISLEYHPDGNQVADISFQITHSGKPLTEKWVYRWAP